MTLILYTSLSTTLLALLVLVLVHLGMRAVRVRRQARNSARQEARSAQVAADEAAWAAYVEDQRAFWAKRLNSGAVLDLDADHRLTLVGKSIKSVDGYGHRHTLRKDVYQWCQQNVGGRYAMVVFFFDQERHARVWFSDPNDAFQFKLRWY